MRVRSWEPTMFYCAGCRHFRDSPAATPKNADGEWTRRPCSPECAALLNPDPAPR